jgi:hypothetical protein
MKKIIALTLIAAITIAASSCSTKTTSGIDKSPEATKPTQTETQPQAQNKPEEKPIEGPKSLAFEGKIDNLKVGVGDELKEVIAALGEPVELAHFEGSSYISYENVNFMLDKIVESTSDEAVVLGIIVSEGYELYGVKVGMNPGEIKNVLGAAEQEYKDGEGDEEMWKLEYNCGEYKLTFFFNDKESPSTSAYLSKL